MNAIELVNGHHEPIPWVIDGLIRPGLTGLVGEQSSGKSTLLTNLMVSAVQGEQVFGHYVVPKARPVIMCAMEETPGDLARYIEKQFRARGLPLNPNLHVYTELPPAGSGGLEELEGLVRDIQPGIVSIDLFGDFDQIPSWYNKARAKFRTWNKRGQEWDCGIIGTLHAYRGGVPASGPWMHKAQGSVGAMGAMVVRMGVARIEGEPRTVLRVTGKGTQNHDLALDFDPATDLFKASDAAQDDSRKPDTMTLKRRLIMDVVAAQEPPGIMATALAEKVKTLALSTLAPVDVSMLSYDNLRQVLHQMVKNPSVPLERVDGRYFTSEQLKAIHPAPAPELPSEDAA